MCINLENARSNFYVNQNAALRSQQKTAQRNHIERTSHYHSVSSLICLNCNSEPCIPNKIFTDAIIPYKMTQWGFKQIWAEFPITISSFAWLSMHALGCQVHIWVSVSPLHGGGGGRGGGT